MKIFVLNGPNLNRLGSREPEKYGTETLPDLENYLKERFSMHAFEFFQSNSEGAIIDTIQKLAEDSDFDGLIGNFAAFTHTSVAIRDALQLLSIPKVEVHLTNIHAREEFRHQSLTAGACDGVVAGFGFQSYVLGVKALEGLTSERSRDKKEA